MFYIYYSLSPIYRPTESLCRNRAASVFWSENCVPTTLKGRCHEIVDHYKLFKHYTVSEILMHMLNQLSMLFRFREDLWHQNSSVHTSKYFTSLDCSFKASSHCLFHVVNDYVDNVSTVQCPRSQNNADTVSV